MRGHLNLRQSARPVQFQQLPDNSLFYVTWDKALKGKLLLKVESTVDQKGLYNVICVNKPSGTYFFPFGTELCFKVTQYFNKN